jgi:hypothetical protein
MNAQSHGSIGRTNSHLRLHALELLLIHVGESEISERLLLRMCGCWRESLLIGDLAGEKI